MDLIKCALGYGGELGQSFVLGNDATTTGEEEFSDLHTPSTENPTQ